MNQERLKKIRLRLALGRPLGATAAILFSVLFVWCLLEGGISLLSFGKHFLLGDAGDETLSSHLLFERDAELGWAPRKNLQVTDAYGGKIKVTTSSRGFRETSRKSAMGSVVLCSGDSFTFGEKVSDTEAWCGVPLEQLGDWRTLNAGVSGYGLDQVYLRFRQQELHYSMHLVGIILDDLTRMKSERSPFGPLKPKLSLQEGKLVAHRGWMQMPGPIRWLIRHGKAVRRLPSMGWLLAPQGPFTASKTEWDEIFQVTGKIFEEFRMDAQKKQAMLGVVLFPTFYDLLHRSQSKERERLLSLLSEQKVRVLDLFPLLEALPLEQVQGLYLSDGHFSVEGHRWAAGSINSFLSTFSPLN